MESMLTDDLEMLVQETFDHKEVFLEDETLLNERKQSVSDHRSYFIEYNIKENDETFSIDGRILDSTEAIEISQRHLNTENLFVVKGHLEKARKVINNICQRRFIKNSLFCDYTEVNSLWWLSYEHNGVGLYFQGRQSKTKMQSICLGPLGDPAEIIPSFTDQESYFEDIFGLPLAKKGGHSLFFAHSMENAEVHELFVDIFLKGKDPEGLYYKLGGHMGHQFYKILGEIASTRKFWLKVLQDLKT